MWETTSCQCALRPLARHDDDRPGEAGWHYRLHDCGAGGHAEVFRRCVREILLPTLKAGDILVMDKLSAHKDGQSLDLLKSAGVTVRFLPAYSPDLNPIELMWSKVKDLLRKAEARTDETFLLAIGDAISQSTQKDATNWFTHCSYGFV